MWASVIWSAVGLVWPGNYASNFKILARNTFLNYPCPHLSLLFYKNPLLRAFFKNIQLYLLSLGNCRGSRVRGRGSRVRSRGSEVEGRESQVEDRGSHVEGREGCMSRVEGCMSRVEGHSLRVRKSRSRVGMFFVVLKNGRKSHFLPGVARFKLLDDCFCV